MCADAQVASTVLFTLTLRFRPFPARLRPADLGGLANMPLHRLCCAAVFLASLVSVVMHAVPGVVYTVMYRRSAPLPPHVVGIGRLHIAALVAVFISAGCMRRGPLLRATEISVGTAFGVKDAAAKPAFWWEDDVGLDVVDYGNCSMLTFLTLGYVSRSHSRAADGFRALRSRAGRARRSSSHRRICPRSRSGCAPRDQSTSSSTRWSPAAESRCTTPRLGWSRSSGAAGWGPF
jgi:hypothetical protein